LVRLEHAAACEPTLQRLRVEHLTRIGALAERLDAASAAAAAAVTSATSSAASAAVAGGAADFLAAVDDPASSVISASEGRERGCSAEAADGAWFLSPFGPSGVEDEAAAAALRPAPRPPPAPLVQGSSRLVRVVADNDSGSDDADGDCDLVGGRARSAEEIAADAAEKELSEALAALHERFGSGCGERRAVARFQHAELEGLLLPPATRFLLWMTLQPDAFFGAESPPPPPKQPQRDSWGLSGLGGAAGVFESSVGGGLGSDMACPPSPVPLPSLFSSASLSSSSSASTASTLWARISEVGVGLIPPPWLDSATLVSGIANAPGSFARDASRADFAQNWPFASRSFVNLVHALVLAHARARSTGWGGGGQQELGLSCDQEARVREVAGRLRSNATAIAEQRRLALVSGKPGVAHARCIENQPI